MLEIIILILVLYINNLYPSQGRLKHTMGPGQKKTHGPYNNLYNILIGSFYQ